MMKNIKKAIMLMMFAALSVMVFGCAKNEGNLQISDSFTAQANGIIGGITNTDDASAAELKAMEMDEIKSFFRDYGYSIEGETFINGLDGWLGLKEEFGQVKGISEPEMSSTPDEVHATYKVEGTTRNGKIIVIMNPNNKITSITTSAEYSFAEKVGKAGLNTVLGMGTTFVILIFLSFIISLFKFLPGNEGLRAKEEPKTPVDNAVSQIAEREELAGDDALVAVITAAVAAYESSNSNAGGSGDGFVVRSIRRHY